MIDLKKIKPEVKGQSDKYSWNLYRFLHKLLRNKDHGKYYKNQLEVLWLHDSRWDGEFLEFNPEEFKTSQVIIMPLGKENGMSFYFMDGILRNGRTIEFVLPRTWEITNITEWFFETYQRDGRCIFDREHTAWLQGSDNRFTYVNNTRKCNWCGEWHHKEIHKEVKIKRHEVWVTQ